MNELEQIISILEQFQKSNLIKQPLIILLMKVNHLQDSEMANLV